jgi:protein-disulfide isomerase
VIIFSDFQSFLCGRTAHVLVDTLGESKDIRLIFKHLPKNDEALLAHEAAIAAGAQGKFWEMHNMLFENQSHLSRADLSNYSRQLGLNVATFNAALDQHTYRNMIAHDLADAKALGVVTAPTFFINGRRLVGPPTPAALKAVLDSVVTGLPSRTSDQDTSPGPAVAIALKQYPAKAPQ